MRTTLYAISLSHPSHAVRIALERKGIAHRVVDLMPGLHPVLLRAAGFRGGTVPALRIDGRRAQHSVAIMRLLEQMQPDSPLYPSDPERRRAVEAAEEWGEREVQPLPRRAFRWSVWHNPELRLWLARAAGLPAPRLMAPLNKPLAIYFARTIGADDAGIRSDMARLPQIVDRVDELIAEGVIGGDQPTAADLQIGTALRVLLEFEDLRHVVQDRPAEQLARRILPRYPGPIARSLPADWLPERRLPNGRSQTPVTNRDSATRPLPDPGRRA
jgi:glutathione S-transferase